jgi:hypothetical protein
LPLKVGELKLVDELRSREDDGLRVLLDLSLLDEDGSYYFALLFA